MRFLDGGVRMAIKGASGRTKWESVVVIFKILFLNIIYKDLTQDPIYTHQSKI